MRGLDGERMRQKNNMRQIKAIEKANRERLLEVKKVLIIYQHSQHIFEAQ